MSQNLQHLYEFEDFRLDTKNPSLWREGRAVPISPKALDTLILLISKPNEIVTREELLGAIWKDTFVEEGNINYTISLLRKTLGNKELIQTVPRRGYRFVGEVRTASLNGSAKTIERLEDDPKQAEPKVEQADPIIKHSAPDTEKDETTIEQAAPNSGTEFPLTETVEKKNQGRWIFFSVAIIFTAFLAGFVYLRHQVKADKQPENSQTANAEAKAAYTRGRMILARRSVENREEKAIDEFQNAVTLDPTFAAGYAGLSEALLSRAVRLAGNESLNGYAKARAAAEKSLELGGNLSNGFLARGWVKRQADWDWAGAETDLRAAIRLDAKNAKAHQRLALLLCGLGRLDEALTESKIAYELDPISDYIVGARFPILEARREYVQALKESEEFVRENKSNNGALRAYATFLYHTGNNEEVIALAEESLAKNPNATPFAWLSLLHAAYYKKDRFDKAEETLRRLETLAEKDTKALYSLAMNYAELGRADESIAILERCFNEREERVVWMKIEPRFVNLQSALSFRRLVKKLNL